MTTIAATQVVEIYLDSPDGVRIALLDQVTSYEYALLVNEPGPFSIRLPYNFDRSMIGVDYIIEIWRGIEGTNLRMDYCGFIRTLEFGDENGLPYTEIGGFSTMELLKRRTARDNGATVNTTLTNEADDLLKAIFTDQFGADSIAARNLTAVAGGVTVQADNAAAPSQTKEFKHKTVYDVMLEIAQTSKEAGTELYFDVVPVIGSITTGNLGFNFETYIGQRGSDRTFDSNNPVYIGPDWENLINGSLTYDYSNEINVVTVLGKGDGPAQETVERTDPTRIATSIWNRREGIKTASNAASGDTAALNAEGDAFLSENKPKLHFTGDIQETQSFRYGYNWFFGDRVTIQYCGMEKDANINKVFVSKGAGPEVITAKMEVDE
jgi:hypothetical protein